MAKIKRINENIKLAAPAVMPVFDFGGAKVRTAGTPDAPLFCAADVCEVLTLGHVSKACERIDQEDVALAHHAAAENKPNALTVRVEKRSLYVTESGLYALIFGCEKPEAKAFKRWVTAEVLPEIRKRGFYDAVEVGIRKQTDLLLEQCFPNLPQKAAPLFRELIASIIRLRREPSKVGQAPAWARGLASMVYGWSIQIDGQQQKRREKNPSPNGSRLDHSMLSEAAREAVRHVAQTGCDFARLPVSYEQWRNQMNFVFSQKSVQLPLMVPILQLGRKK